MVCRQLTCTCTSPPMSRDRQHALRAMHNASTEKAQLSIGRPQGVARSVAKTMVIPMGAMGTPLVGPPPQELEGRFRILKVCVLAMLIGTAVRILSALFGELGAGQVILSSINIILNSIIGVFLLKYDYTVGKIHNFLVTTCCASCDESCGGGMQCLMTFVLCNALTVLLDLLLNAVIQRIVLDIGVIFDPNQWLNALTGFFLGVNVLSVIVVYVAQITGAVQGFMAYRQAQSAGITQTGGDWSTGGAPFGGGGGGAGRSGYPPAREDTNAPARESRPAANFQPFGGSGNRLGS